MQARRGTLIALLAGCALLALAAPSAQTPQTPQGQPTFRTATTLVPVDVRVLDRDGKPVTDLAQSDFTVLENGVRQDIRHFSTHAFTSEVPSPNGALAARTTGRDDITPQNRRVFLIVLGRGRLQPPAKGVDGMLHFVRDRLLPQDLVAVLAWDRATEFTTDHAKVADLLDRFKRMHEGIESKLKMRFSGLAAIYGSKAIPPAVQKDIDAVFGGPRAAGVRTVSPGVGPNGARMADDTRQITDLLLNPATLDPIAAAQAEQIGMELDEFVAANAQTNQDVGNLYMGVEYLRHLEGEKHLVFVSESGLMLPRAEDDKDLAAAATDARVAIDYVHTGGTPMGNLATTFSAEARGRGPAPAPAPARPIARPDQWTFSTARSLADLTGGRFFGNRFPSAAVDMDYVDQATRFEYTLGYYPSRTALDGKYRQISIRVNRPGLTLLFRHGYYATPTGTPFDRRRVLTYSRVAATANYAEEVHDIKLQLKASSPKSPTPAQEVLVEMMIDPSRLGFTKANGLNTASIEVAVFCADGNDNPVGHSWQTIQLTFSDDRLQQFIREGLAHKVTIQVGAPAKRVKAVVYDYAADLVGSTIVKVQ